MRGGFECAECCSRELATYALPLVCAEVVCETSLKGVPQNVSSEHFWGISPWGDLKQLDVLHFPIRDEGWNLKRPLSEVL